MAEPKKPHRATGKPKGGARPGAGRPKGIKNTLPLGMVKAMKAISRRLPSDASEDEKTVVERSLQRVADVMEGKVHSSIATPVLKAATYLNEEICGPVARTVNLNAKLGLAELLDEATKIAEEEAAPPAEVPPEPVVAKAPIVRKKAT